MYNNNNRCSFLEEIKEDEMEYAHKTFCGSGDNKMFEVEKSSQFGN